MWQLAWQLTQSNLLISGIDDLGVISNENQLSIWTFRPHVANFASEASPGTMAGLVPQNSINKGFTEVMDRMVFGEIGRIHFIGIYRNHFLDAMPTIGFPPACSQESHRQLPQP